MIAFALNTTGYYADIKTRALNSAFILIHKIYDSKNITKAAIAINNALATEELKYEFIAEYNANTILLWVMDRNDHRLTGEGPFLTIFATDI